RNVRAAEAGRADSLCVLGGELEAAALRDRHADVPAQGVSEQGAREPLEERHPFPSGRTDERARRLRTEGAVEGAGRNLFLPGNERGGGEAGGTGDSRAAQRSAASQNRTGLETRAGARACSS